MRYKKQDVSLSIGNVEIGSSEGCQMIKHSPLLPNSIRCLICGPSNCGKTNLILNLIYSPNGLKFQNIYLFSKSIYQPKYVQMKNIFSTFKEIGLFLFENNEQVPQPNEALPDSIIIFDDIAVDKQDRVRSYFCMGRHSGIDSFYLCQSYTRVPKHLIRDNANLLIIFKQDLLNMRRLFEDHVNSDMSFKEFTRICQRCWDDSSYGFLVLDKDSPLKNGRYRKGFDTYIML